MVELEGRREGMRIRPAGIADLPEIVRVYNQSIPSRSSTADMDPLTAEERRGWFEAHSPDHYPLFVAEEGSRIAGWCAVSPWRQGRRALFTTAEISFYIDSSFRRQGVASRLIEHALAACPDAGIRNLLAILLDVNAPSICLLEKWGFREWGHLPDVADFDGKICGQLIYGRAV